MTKLNMTLIDPPPLVPFDQLPERVQRTLRIYQASKMGLHVRISQRFIARNASPLDPAQH